MLTKVAKK